MLCEKSPFFGSKIHQNHHKRWEQYNLLFLYMVEMIHTNTWLQTMRFYCVPRRLGCMVEMIHTNTWLQTMRFYCVPRRLGCKIPNCALMFKCAQGKGCMVEMIHTNIWLQTKRLYCVPRIVATRLQNSEL
jgi:hypothetical protein